MPKVSVIIPTYNREKYIADCIQSVIEQTFSDWELIIVNDGSTDNTEKVIFQYSEKIKYIYQNNAGVQTARNKGFSVSTGEYILFLDSDDILLPHNLEYLVKILDNDKNIDVSYGWYFWMDENKEPVVNPYSRIRHESYPPECSFWPDSYLPPDGSTLEGKIFPEILCEESILIGSTLIRRKCLENVGGFNPQINYMEHWELFTRIAEAGYVFSCARRPVLVIRLHSSNRAKDLEGMLHSYISVLEKHKNNSDSINLTTEYLAKAYFEIHYEITGDYFSNNEIQNGIKCLQKAFLYPHRKDLENHFNTKKIADMIITFSFRDSPAAPIQYAKEIFNRIGFTKQIKPLRKMVLDTIYQRLYWENQKNKKLAQNYGFFALWNNPKLLKNRGFIKTFTKLFSPYWLGGIIHKILYPTDPAFIEKASKTVCIFISPHFDDAVLSCGGLMGKLSERKANVVSITVFTKEPPVGKPLPLIAQGFHQAWNSGENPYEIRKEEEKNVLNKLNSAYKWLEKPDVIYRYPEVKFKNNVLFTGVSPEEDPILPEITDEFLKIVNDAPDCYIFAPLGIGEHPDHLVVNLALRSIKNFHPQLNLFFYEDFPYAITGDRNKRLAKYGLKLKSKNIDIDKMLGKRIELIKLYKSQLEDVFEEPVDKIDQVVEDYCEQVGLKNRPQERYWYY